MSDQSQGRDAVDQWVKRNPDYYKHGHIYIPVKKYSLWESFTYFVSESWRPFVCGVTVCALLLAVFLLTFKPAP
jgi:hypothetical protein